MLEEAGIKIKNIRLEAVVLELKPYKATGGNWLIFHFTADYDSGQIGQTDEGELVMLEEKEIYKQNLFPSIREIIHHKINIFNQNPNQPFFIKHCLLALTIPGF